MIQFFAPIIMCLFLAVFVLCIVGVYQSRTGIVLIDKQKLDGWVIVLAISGGIFVLVLGIYAIVG